MAPEEHARLLELADAIGDETPVDWDAETSDHPQLAGIIGRLQRVEHVAAAFRELQDIGGEVETTGDELFTWGHLRVREKLGEGSFGEVFRAYDPLLQRDVALKLRRMGPSHSCGSGQRFVEEARRLARIRHANVVAVFGTDMHNDRVGLWTELVDGFSLAERLESDGPFGPHEAVSVGIDVCRALAAVHSVGLVHGDVKAANVLRERGGRIVLTDFGSGTEDGAAAAPFGSPASVAPEVLGGEPTRPVSDLYSLGSLLFHLLTGTHPVPAENPFELVEAHRLGKRRSLRDLRPELPAELIRVVERALDPDPAARFASAGDMERALTHVLDAAPEPAIQRPDSRRRMRVAFAVAATVAAGAAVTAMLLLVVDHVGTTPDPVSVSTVHQPSEAATVHRLERPSPASDEPIPSRVADKLESVENATIAEAVAPFEVEATLFRGEDQSETPLSPGDTIQPGDLLHLELSTTEETHLYVLNEDRLGDLFILFPIAGLDFANPLPAGQHRLPGRLRGVQQEWRVTSAGGTETFLLVASRVRMEELEQQLAGFRAAAENPQEAGTGETLRGVGGLSRSPSTVQDGSQLRSIHDALLRLREDGGSVWVQRFELLNPVR